MSFKDALKAASISTFIKWSDLIIKTTYVVKSLRRSTTSFGNGIVITILIDLEEKQLYLPKRYANLITG